MSEVKGFEEHGASYINFDEVWVGRHVECEECEKIATEKNREEANRHAEYMIHATIAGLPLMTGSCGDFVDRINQKLQVLICKLDGDAEGERLVEEIAQELRDHYREHKQ